MKHGDKVRLEILEAGLKLWHYDPSKVNARNIAKLIGKTHPAVYHHFPSNIKNAVAGYGVRKNDSTVIVSLILTNNHLISHLTPEERLMHLNAICDHKKEGHPD